MHISSIHDKIKVAMPMMVASLALFFLIFLMRPITASAGSMEMSNGNIIWTSSGTAATSHYTYYTYGYTFDVYKNGQFIYSGDFWDWEYSAEEWQDGNTKYCRYTLSLDYLQSWAGQSLHEGNITIYANPIICVKDYDTVVYDNLRTRQEVYDAFVAMCGDGWYVNESDYNIRVDWHSYYMGVTWDDGISSVSGGNCWYDKDATATLTAYVKTGYSFDYWDNGLGSTYTVNPDTYGMFSNRNVSAHSRPNNYTVYFHGNGGTVPWAADQNNGDDNQRYVTVTYDSGDYCTRSGVTPSRKGYTFTGWYTADGKQIYDANGNATYNDYWQNNIWKATSDLHVYAHWQVNEYDYTINHWQQNIGADASQHDSNNYTLIEADSYTSKADFDTTWMFSTNYYDGFHVAYINAWDTKTHEQEFPYYIGNPYPTMDASATITINSDDKTQINFYYDRNYYKFGNMDSDNFSLNGDIGVDYTEHWSNNATGHHGWYQYGESIGFNAVMKLGYNWTNWTNDTAYNTEYTRDKNTSITMPAHDLQLTAHTYADTFSVNYDYDNGDIAASNIQSYTVESKPFTLIEPVKIGYTLIGWTGSTTYQDMFNRTGSATWNTVPVTLTPDTKASPFVINPATSSMFNPIWIGVGTRTYKAEYMAHQYYITYDANIPAGCTSDLVGSMTDTLHSFDDYWRVPRTGAVTNIAQNKYSLDGYDFVNWNTKPDGSGMTYADKAKHNNLTTEDGKTLTLYAQWRAHDYDVVLHSNDKEVKADMYNAGTATGKSADNSDIQSYLDTSFNTPIGQLITYDNQATNINANPNRPFETNVTFPLMEEYVADSSGKYIMASAIDSTTGVQTDYFKLATKAELANPTLQKYSVKTNRRIGFNFIGWSTNYNPDDNSVIYHDGASIKNLTDAQGKIVKLYAIWQPKTFTLMKTASSMYQGSMATDLYNDRVNDLGISEADSVIQYEIDEDGHITTN